MKSVGIKEGRQLPCVSLERVDECTPKLLLVQQPCTQLIVTAMFHPTLAFEIFLFMHSCKHEFTKGYNSMHTSLVISLTKYSGTYF